MALVRVAICLAFCALLLADFSPTLAAQSMAVPDDRIGLIEWMPGVAVRFSGVVSGEPHSSALIFAHGNRFQVARVNTGALSAQMIDMQSGRDWSDHVFIHESMGSDMDSSDCHGSVSTSINVAIPYPAPVVRLLDFVQCSFQGISGGPSSLPWPSLWVLAIQDMFSISTVVGDGVFGVALFVHVVL